MQNAVDAIEGVSFYERIRRKFFPIKRNMLVIPTNSGLTNFHVGRKTELEHLQRLVEKRVNVLLLGPQGIGKSHSLDNLRLEKILRIDEMRNIKQTLIGILIELYEGKKKKLEIGERRLKSMTPRKPFLKLYTKKKMKNHFHFVIAARKIKYSQMSFVTNFEKIELERLPRAETIKLS